MSGMFDAKPDKNQRKQERSAKEDKARRKSKIITISVSVVFLLFLCFALLINSSWLRRTLPVVTIDGVSFTTTEYEYFFNVQYMEYVNFMSQFQGMAGAMPDPNRPLSGQIYNRDTGETWADFIGASTYARMKFLVGLYNTAVADGFELSDELLAEIEDEMLMIELQAEFTEGITSANMLLQRIYGTSMNTTVFRKLLTFVVTAEEYSEFIRGSFEYSDAQLDEFYAENANDLDIFTFRLFPITAQMPEQGIEDYDELREEAIADAKALAAEIANTVTSQEEFIEAAFNYNETTFADPDSMLREMQGERLDEDYSEWLQESIREQGHIAVVDTELGATLVYFVSRERNDYKTVDMRQILILVETISPGEFTKGVDDPEYDQALLDAEADAQERAETVNALFISAGRTKEALLDLMEEHSDDNTEGGLYEGISRFQYQGATFRTMRVVPELEEWLFEAGRSAGDSKMIETEAFGFHLMYFEGFNKLFKHVIADDRMRTDAHDEWLESIEVGEPVRHLAFVLVHR
ncbi:MAG: hypothetical protein FWD44_02280 [Oscillospiraceae bacterium]|nr:hypothetical protein [Oscillospiraceae bacterium]